MARVLRRHSDYEMFVATLPIEYIKLFASLVAGPQHGSQNGCLVITDVKKAFVYDPAQRGIYVQLPAVGLGPGGGELLRQALAVFVRHPRCRSCFGPRHTLKLF